MSKRIDSVDAVRGALMVFMLLDHTRDFTHAGAFFNDPLDPATSTPILYLTRWITHLCAPGFVFLAGMGAGLQLLRGTPVPDLARFLWTRGFLLLTGASTPSCASHAESVGPERYSGSPEAKPSAPTIHTRRLAYALCTVAIIGCHSGWRDDLERQGLSQAVEDHAWHLEHGAKVDAIEVGKRRFSRSECAAALRRFALIARTATSDGDANWSDANCRARSDADAGLRRGVCS